MVDYIVNQFPIDKYVEMIFAFLSLIESFEKIIDNEDYYIRITPKYELKIGSYQIPTSSKVESFIISKYDNEDKMKECISKYLYAYKTLNEMEKKVFIKYFLENKSDYEIIIELDTYSNLLNRIKKSAVVRFSLILGFDKLEKYF